MLGLCFIVLLERGPGREHITVQSYMLALVAGLGAIFAGIIAIEPVRTFFDLEVLSGGQWFLALLSVALGLGLAGAAWQLPYMQRLELPEGAELEPDDGPEPTHTPRTGEFDAVAMPAADREQEPDDASEAPTTVAPTERMRGRELTIARTKIVTTIGPATRTVEGMVELIEAGADVFRLNFSHGTREDHSENVAMAREAAERTGKQVGILGDLPGPKLRIGDVDDGIVGLRPGSEIVLTTEDVVGSQSKLSVSYEGLPEAVTKDGLVYLADGRIRLRVLEAGDDEVRCSVEVGGRVSSHQGLNLPGAEVGLPAAGREDLAWVDFAIEHGIDLLAISFVRRAEDLAPVERRVRTGGSDIPVIAKIEKPEAAERAEEIVKAVKAGIMVARGDLGIELPIEQVPGVQRRLLALAGRYSIPRSPPPRCSPRWSPRRGRRAPRSPTSRTRSSRAPTL